MTLQPRAVVVSRRSELEELVARHGTRGQVEFFLSTRGRNLDEVQARSDALRHALQVVASAIPLDWRRAEVERTDLPRFLFGPGDVVVAVGQDGLVANVAKYLSGQPVIGIDPEPGHNPGLLVPHRAEAIHGLLEPAAHEQGGVELRTMVQAETDDGRRLIALNEVYLGHASHQTSRWTLDAPNGKVERQACSGLVVSTGTGATGWCSSLWRDRGGRDALPRPTERWLAWFVREAWESPVTGRTLTSGACRADERLSVTSESDRLVTFGDGIETDALELTWGQTVRVGIAAEKLQLVTG